MLISPKNRQRKTNLFKTRWDKIRDVRVEKILGIETRVGEGVLKEETFTQNKKHPLIIVSGGRNRTRGKITETPVMPINAITSREVV